MKCLKQHIRNLNKDQFNELNLMCTHSRALYNSALYVVKNYYKETGKYISYFSLYHEMKTNIHYKSLNTKASQQILRLVDKDYRSFFALLKRKLKGQYTADISEPKYKRKDSQFILVFPKDAFSVKNNILKITKSLKLNFSYKLNGTPKQLIIKPNGFKYFTILIQYEETKIESLNLNKDSILGIDLGLNNFASCLSNNGTSLIVNGKPLKSYNQYWNKQKSLIQSELQLKNKRKWSKKLNILSINRSNWINNYLNQSVSIIIKHCLNNNIGTIICGYNESWKQNLNLGRVNNQNFTSIPHYLFKTKLNNKCKENGIEFILHEESYTSKCSFLDNEELKKKNIYLGKRIHRGLFKTLKGILCNADIQSSGNIIKKVVPNTKFVDGIEGCIVSPKVLNIF